MNKIHEKGYWNSIANFPSLFTGARWLMSAQEIVLLVLNFPLHVKHQVAKTKALGFQRLVLGIKVLANMTTNWFAES